MEPSNGELPERLLAHIRKSSDNPNVAYALSPRRLTEGYETLTYAFDLQMMQGQPAQPFILRMFRNDGWPHQSRFEAAVLRAVTQQSFPSPSVLFQSDGHDELGAPFLIMKRLPGTTMLELLRNPIAGRRVAALLAGTQPRLHELDTGRLQRALDDAGLSAAATIDAWFERIEWRIDKASLDGLRLGQLWLVENRPSQPTRLSICHGDFHVNNVLVYKGGVSGVIDWSLTRIADPAFDVGNTRVLMMLEPRGGPGFLQPILGLMTRNLARRYYAAYRKLRAVDASAVRYYEALRCLHSLVWAGQHRAAAANGVELGPNPWAADRESSRLIAHFRRITGRTLQLPPVP